MKIFKNELKKYIDLKDISNKVIYDSLNKIAFEVEGITFPHKIKDVKLAKVLSVEKHPNADNLNFCKLSLKGSIHDVVCGGKNVKKGQVVAYAPINSKVGEFVMAKKNIRGKISEGMILSISEIMGFPKEITEEKEMKNIHVFSKETNLESSVEKELELNQYIFDVSILPDRQYANNYLNFARDLSVFLERKFKLPILKLPKSDLENKVDVVLKEKASSIFLSKVKLKKSFTPEYIKTLLYINNVKPENTIRDLIYYVSIITGNVIYFTNDAKKVTLDNRELILDDQKYDLLNSDAIINTKKEGLVISLSSDFTSNIKNEKEINKDFGMRNLKSTSNLYSEYALQLFLHLAQKYNFLDGSSNISGKIENKKENIIKVSDEYIWKVIGQKIKLEPLKDKLKILDFNIENKKYIVPSYRKDILMNQDIIEEIIRFYGIENIKKGNYPYSNSKKEQKHKKAFNVLIQEMTEYGFYEVKNYHLKNKKESETYNIWNIKEKIELDESYNFELNTLQTSLLGGLIESHSYNYKKDKNGIKMFEISNIYHDKIPKYSLGFIHEENLNPENPSIWTKSMLIKLLEKLNIKEKELEYKENNNSCFNPNNSIDVYYNETLIAKLGELHPKILRDKKYIRLDKIKRKLYYCELILESIIN